MFGYVKPFKPDLKISEFDVYKSIYCRLCEHMGKNFGIKSRILLSYDCTFIAMMSLAMKDCDIKITNGRCACNYFKKCAYIQGCDTSFDFAAAVGIIMSYYKMRDNVVDSKFIKKNIYRFISLVFYFQHKKAAKAYPKIEETVKKFFYMQQEVETKKGHVSIDESAHPTADTVSNIMSMISSELKDFGYFLGRWVYIIDASDDIIKDAKQNNFNPLQEIKDDKVQINQILNQTVFEILRCYESLDFKKFNPIIGNIVKLGLADMQKKILFEKREDK